MEKGTISMEASRIIIENKFNDCTPASLEYHEDVLYYRTCPDRGPYDSGPGLNDLPAEVPDTFIPCWGVIEDHIGEALAYGQLNELSNVSTTAPSFGQALAWNGTEWAPSSDIAADVSNNSIGDLADVDTQGAQIDHVLKWDGAKWVPDFTISSLLDLPDVGYAKVDDTNPISKSVTKDPPQSNEITGGEGIHSAASSMLDIGTEGFRGLQWDSGGAVSSLYNMTNNSTILTSALGSGGGAYETHLELNPSFVRFNGSGLGWGGQGFLLGYNLKITYENQDRTWDNFGAYDVAPKGVIKKYVDDGLADLDLSNNILEDIGNVDTQGKGLGYALVWDGTNWGASNSVAADITLASIGELVDVVKVANTDADTNDGSISFDVPTLLTSRPLHSNGGLTLDSTDGNASIGWSSSSLGSPLLENRTATFSGNVASQISVEPLQINVQSSLGMQYLIEPGLQSLTIPSYGQVVQQIARQQTDYTALFYMDGNTFSERNYGWPLDIQVTTQPNPAYFSKFDGQYSYSFNKLSQDKFIWKEDDGCPRLWSMETLWSFEFWIYNDSTSAGDDLAELIIAPHGDTPGAEILDAICFGLDGDDRTSIFITADRFRTNTVNAGGSKTIKGNISFDEWHHVCAMQEGQGRVRLYVDGQRVGEFQTNKALELPGGLSVGGRRLSSSTSTAGYLTAFVDDLRITKGWLPYTPDQQFIPVPAAPLQAGAFRASYGTLNSLEDVNTVNPEPINGNVLMWDNIVKQWKPGPADALSYDISSSQITNLADVDTETSVPGEDDILRWNTVTDQWERSRIDGNGGVRPINARSATAGVEPSALSLFAGEIFINMADKKAYTLDDSGQPFAFAVQADIDGIIDQIDNNFDRVVGGTF